MKTRNFALAPFAVMMVFTLLTGSPVASGEVDPVTEQPKAGGTKTGGGDQAVVEITEIKMPLSKIEPGVGEVPVRVIETKSGKQYKVPDGPITMAQKTAYESLTPEQRDLFNERRVGALKMVTGFLNKVHLVPGFGNWAFDRVVHVFKKRKGRKYTMSQLGQRLTGRMVRAISGQMWDHTEVVVNANEFGFRLSAGADAGLGTGNKGFYEGLGVGIWIGYNHDKKEIGFTIFGERDGWVSAIPGVGLAEVRAKVLFTAKANDGEAPKVVEKKRLLFLALAAIQDDPKAVEAGLKVGVGPFIVHPVYQELTNTIFNVIGGTASPKTTGIFRITGAAGAVVGGILRSPYDFYKLVTTGKWGGPRKLSSVVERTKTDDKPPFSASIGVCYRDGFRRLSGKD